VSGRLLRIAYLVAFLGMAVGYYYALGAAPTPSERREEIAWWRPRGLVLETESAWLAPLQSIASDAEQARHEGRSAPRGMIPVALFALPAIAATALGFLLFRSPVSRAGILALGLALCAFSYYGWLDPETWRDYGWRWPAVLLSTSFYVSLFALAPSLVRAAGARSRAFQVCAAIAWFVPIYLLSIEVTGTNPRLQWNLSPWPTLTLYGFLLVGLVLGVVHFATGAGLLALALRVGPGRGLVAAAVAAGTAAALSGVPFASRGWLQMGAVALPAALLAVTAGRTVVAESRARARAFVAAGLLVLLAIKLGQWQGERFLAQSRDEIAPRVIAALERFRADHGSYPESLVELRPTYLAAIPFPRVGWFDSNDETFIYTYLGDSFLLEFPGIVWVQCAYSPAYVEDTQERQDKTAAVSAAPPGAEVPAEETGLGAAWSCTSKPPRLW
jgi:hypothetical protein